MTASRLFGAYRLVVTLAMLGAVALPVVSLAQDTGQQSDTEAGKKRYRGRLGPGDPRIKRQNGKILVWASPRDHPPDSPDAEWYDFTGAPFPPEELQFGIGKDRIRAIDDPLFVEPDDPRLLKYIPPSRYRPSERPQTNGEIPVIGCVNDDVVRAYPIALLDGHELVNDRVGGKAVTVGW